MTSLHKSPIGQCKIRGNKTFIVTPKAKGRGKRLVACSFNLKSCLKKRRKRRKLKKFNGKPRRVRFAARIKHVRIISPRKKGKGKEEEVEDEEEEEEKPPKKKRNTKSNSKEIVVEVKLYLVKRDATMKARKVLDDKMEELVKKFGKSQQDKPQNKSIKGRKIRHYTISFKSLVGRNRFSQTLRRFYTRKRKIDINDWEVL